MLGVLAGSGPAAGAHVLSRIVALAQEAGAREDTDFPEVLLLSVALPGLDHTASLAGSSAARAHVVAGLRRLERAGASTLAIACNSLHHRLEDLRAALDTPVLDLRELLARELALTGGPVGVLASRSARDLGVHHAALRARGLGVLLPLESEQRELDALVLSLMGSTPTSAQRDVLDGLVAALASRGARSVLAGCTELGLLSPLAPAVPLVPVIDSAEVLALALLAASASSVLPLPRLETHRAPSS